VDGGDDSSADLACVFPIVVVVVLVLVLVMLLVECGGRRVGIGGEYVGVGFGGGGSCAA